MRFRNCDECGEYKYIERDGLCPSCTPEGRVNLRLDVVSSQLGTPEILQAISEAMDSETQVTHTGDTTEISEFDDDLDLGTNAAGLYKANKRYPYNNYTGSKAEQVKSALNDAYSDAIQLYGED